MQRTHFLFKPSFLLCITSVFLLSASNSYAQNIEVSGYAGFSIAKHIKLPKTIQATKYEKDSLVRDKYNTLFTIGLEIYYVTIQRI